MAVNSTDTSTKSSYSYLQYKNKIGGLVSGMDIDSLMEKLMKAESSQMEKLQQQKTKYEWKRDAYREVNTKLKTFEESALTSYGLQSSWNAKSVTASSTAVSAVATANANGTLNIEEATLANAGYVKTSLGSVTASTGKISDLGISATSGKFSFSIDGGATQTIEYSKDDTLDSLVKKLNDTGVFEATIKDGKLSTKVKDGKEVNADDSTNIYSSAFAKKLGFTLDGTSKLSENASASFVTTAGTVKADNTISSLGLSAGEFTIKAVDEKGEYITKKISYKETDKISDVMNRINSSGVGVTAILSGSELSLTANIAGEGKDGAMNIEKDDNGFFQKLGLLDGKTGDLTAKGTSGTNGSIVVNGVKIEGTSNTYSVSGYSLTINQTITKGTDAPTKISSTTDTDKIVDKVKEFVKTYNELIANVSQRTTEKRKVGYDPLTDAQKAEMNTAEIEKWEETAKKGLLKGDATLNKVLSDMRTTLSTYGTKDAEGNSTPSSTDILFKIGITTSSTWSDGGKLEIDEDKLKQALADDPNIVSRIFAGDSSTNQEGVISSLRKTAQNAVSIIKESAGSESSTSDTTYSIGKTISSLSTKIDDWKDRLKDIEERYWKQFSAMETAIQKANSQSSIFTQ